MYNQKPDLRRETDRNILFLRLTEGIKSVIMDLRKLLALAVYMLVATLLLIGTQTFGFDIVTINLPTDVTFPMFVVIFYLYVFVCLFLFFLVIGTPPGSRKIANNLRRSGVKNHEGESANPLSIRKDKDNPRIIIMELDANSIPISEFENKRSNIEAALNVNVVKITEGKNKRRILLYVVPTKYSLPKILYWRKIYLSQKNFEIVLGENLLGVVAVNLAKIPHLLLGGSTGSGKTVLLKLILMQCIKKSASVCIADFKGGVDFPNEWQNCCKILYEREELLDMLTAIVYELEDRKRIFKEVQCANIDEYNSRANKKLHRIIFACDEVAEILDKTGIDKAQKEWVAQIENKLSVIARQGRAFGIHLILATQRPDATIIPGQIRNNIDCRVCGRADNILSQIILDSTDASDRIPKDAQGLFLMNDGTLFQGYLFDEQTAFED